MTVTYSLAPEPIWVIINNEGTVAGGAKMYTKRSLNKVEDKPVYMDAGGTQAWTNPILFNLNGTNGPFYFKVDSTNLEDTYYLRVTDADDNLLWDVDNFFPSGSGGGGTVTTFISLQNYVTNNQFINHIADTASPTNSTNLLIAPSNHKGFTPALINPVVGTYGVLGSDIRFVKNNTTATDQITFPLFALADAPLTGDVTPVDYIRYQSNGVIGETYKCFQFPITQKIKNLSNQAMTFTFWAKVTATPVTIRLYSRQYYGSGTAATAESSTTRPLQDSFTLTTTWTQYSSQFTVPNVSGNSIGTPNLQTDDDAFYMQLEMPLNTACDVQFTKPCLFLGTVDPSKEFISYDEIDSVNSTARTGDIKTSLLSTPPMGWLAMNDTSIGNTGSGATSGQTGAQFFQLYKTVWDGILDTWAPVSTGRGASAIADFLAGKTLTLPKSLGRALAGAGAGSGLTSRPLGSTAGSETISIAAMPSHDHPGSYVQVAVGTAALGGGAVGATNFTSPVIVAPQGGGAADGNMEPTSFFNVFIKL